MHKEQIKKLVIIEGWGAFAISEPSNNEAFDIWHNPTGMENWDEDINSTIFDYAKYVWTEIFPQYIKHGDQVDFKAIYGDWDGFIYGWIRSQVNMSDVEFNNFIISLFDDTMLMLSEPFDAFQSTWRIDWDRDDEDNFCDRIKFCELIFKSDNKLCAQGFAKQMHTESINHYIGMFEKILNYIDHDILAPEWGSCQSIEQMYLGGMKKRGRDCYIKAIDKLKTQLI